MSKKYDLLIIIPCYNEAERLPTESYIDFLNNHERVMLCFVNDGSTDATDMVLADIGKQFPGQVNIIRQPKNLGKAEAVRTGILFCHKNYEAERLAYLDADLSTSLEECKSISRIITVTSSTLFVFGSRISKLGSTIHRKRYRFLIGRAIATLISIQLGLKVYDTQCGCKVFKSSLIEPLFKEKFISRWLFDVELFHRLIRIYGRDKLKYLAKEIPLQRWCDTNDSRVCISYFPKLWMDLRNIYRAYNLANEDFQVERETIFN
ncbi:MAG: glycosyltransferase [Bacteroidota bacterium]